MNVFEYAAVEEANWKANLKGMTEYQPMTTFFSDYSIAEFMEGENGIRDTYKRAFNEWKNDIKYITEMCMVLNHKIWEWYERGKHATAMVYDELWKECAAYIEGHFEGEDLSYYYRVTD